MNHSLVAVMAQAPSSGGGGGLSILLLQFLAIGLVFYFLIIRPQAAARRKHQELLVALKKGDEVMTAGGIIGRVKDIKEMKEPAEVRVTIETGTSTVVVERTRIVRVGASAAGETAQK